MKSWRLLLILLAGCIIYVPVKGSEATENVEVEVTGYGSDRAAAVFDGLSEAVRQVHGVQISSQRRVSEASQELMVTGPDGDSSKIEFSANNSGSISADTQGYVSGYRVLSAQRAEPSGFEVTLSVSLPVYRGPGQRTHETRRRMAVYPFTAGSRLLLLGEYLDSETAARRLTESVVEALVGTRRFAVLERQRSQAIQEERSLLTDPSVPVEEKARLSNTIGADYIMLGRLQGMDIDSGTSVSSLTGETSVETSGSMVVDLRVISPATRQIHWADSFVIRANRVFEATAEEDAWQSFEHEIWALAARQLTQRAIWAIYPLRPVSISPDGEVVINQGGSQLQQGQELALFRLGEELRDPYSGEKLGRRENEVGRLIVQRVESKVSYASLISGDAPTSSSPEEFLIRPVETRAGPGNGEDPKWGSRGGVRLPNDPR
jgi:hypothetical protein